MIQEQNATLQSYKTKKYPQQKQQQKPHKQLKASEEEVAAAVGTR